QNVCAWSEHVLRMVGGMGRASYLKVSPAACGPITSGGRIYTLTRPTGHLALPVLSLPFPASPVNSDQFPRFEPHFVFPASSTVSPCQSQSSPLFFSASRDFSPPPLPRQFPAHPFISQFLSVFHNFHNFFSFPSSVPFTF
ncbi:MAG: hypothetical protein NXI25_26550, partial [bacterium]|nr:hypothetical protein [bacterium]